MADQDAERWVEVVDPKWEQELKDQAQHYNLFSCHWWVAKKQQKLGNGTFGKVQWVQRKDGSPCLPCAAKVIESRRSYVHRHREQEVLMWATEWHIHKIVSGHPNIVRLIDVYFAEHTQIEKGRIALIMQLCGPHDLADFIHHYADVHISDATIWTLHMCTGLGHLHSCNVMHRDIKPSNCLLFHRPMLSTMVKLADFGQSAVLTRKGDEKGVPTRTLLQDVTTFRYAAPEVLRHEPYSFLGDVWGVGVICWEMLQSDPREPAVGIDDHDGHDARVTAVGAFQKEVETQSENARNIPLFHLAWSMLQEASKRPSAKSTLDFDVFRGIGTLAADIPASPTTGESAARGSCSQTTGKPAPAAGGQASPTTAEPASAAHGPRPPTTGKSEPAAGGPVSPTTGELAPATGGPAQDKGGAENVGFPQRPLDAVIAAKALMPHFLPGDVSAFSEVMHQHVMNAIWVSACWGFDAKNWP